MESVIDVEQEVIRTLSPNEVMNREDRTFPEEYWEAGRSALTAIRAGLEAARMPASSVRRVLDLPCGHGRVMRYLRAAFPQADLTACDLLKDGVDFCASVFGASPIYSQEDAAKIPIDDNEYDLIWVGSLFTHLDAPRWVSLLAKLGASLREGGLLVFSTHGDYVYRRMSGLEDTSSYGLPYWRVTRALYHYERSGFGYGNYTDDDNYGVSLSDPHWVLSTVTAQRGLRCVYFAERAWHGVQDVYACVKKSHPSTTKTATSLTQYMKHMVREVWKPQS